MKLDGDLAKLIAAAHKGNDLAKHAINVIEDTEKTLIETCQKERIMLPRGFWKTQIEEAIAKALIEASPWLKSITDKEEGLLL